MTIMHLVEPNMYQDSVKLMKLSSAVQSIGGVIKASVVMGTEMNKAVLQEIGLLLPEFEGTSANDLIIVVEAEDETAAAKAIGIAAEGLKSHKVAAASSSTGRRIQPKSVSAGAAELPGADLALISVPGPFAALEAMKAMNAGLHVHIFSDNVTIEDEVKIKQMGVRKGLLVMGPDCGTAIIGGVPLAFANVVSRGPIGIVGASGTGIQEATVLIDHLGSGISHAIGTGGRDLSNDVGGLMMQSGIDLLEADPDTKVLLLISKPPGAETARQIAEKVRRCRKPVVLCMIKGEVAGVSAITAATIEDAAYKAVALANDEEPSSMPANYWSDYRQQADRLGTQLNPCQKYLRGLFTGGTLADEAMVLAAQAIGPIFSNIPLKPEWRLEPSGEKNAHTVIDLGDDEFTRGRPHPMIDPTPRNERIVKEFADPGTAVILCDVVTGFGSHPDPAGELAGAVRRARSAYPKNKPVVIAFVCGTDADPQPLNKQTKILEQEDIHVLPSNALAARVAVEIIRIQSLKGGAL